MRWVGGGEGGLNEVGEWVGGWVGGWDVPMYLDMKSST